MKEAEKEKLYYWIKLKTDFFADDSPFDALMGLENGSEYICLYLKLCMMAANSDGKLAKQFGEILVPYDVEKIKRDAKYFSIDTVRVGLELFSKFGLIYKAEDNALEIANFEEMVGKETKWAKYKRKERIGKSLDNFQQEIRDKSIDIKSIEDRDQTDKKNTIYLSIPNLDEVDQFCMKENLDVDPEHFIAYYTARDWKIGSEPIVDWQAAVRAWHYNKERMNGN